MSATTAAPSTAAGPVRHRHGGLALATIGAAQLMVMLDLTIVNVALPSIQKVLGFSSTNLEWVINAYIVTFGGLLLLGGRSGDLFGRRRMFVTGVALFSVSSLLGGFATDQAWLIAARAVQGAGAAIASPTALSLIASTFEDGPPRHRAMAVYAAMSGAGAGVGLLVGGLLTQWVSWRWVLFVNVPIGALVVLSALLVLDPVPGTPGRLDLPGAATATAGLALLVFGLARAADFGWGDPVTLGALTSAVVLIVGFVGIEATSGQPLVPLRFFAARNRAGGYGIMLLLGAGMLSLMYFMTQYFQDVLGYSPVRTGLAILPMPVTVGIVSQIASRLVGRVGVRPLLTVGPLFVTGGLFSMSFVSASSAYPAVLFPLLLTGTGMGLSFIPLTLNAVGAVRRDEQGLASALLNTSQQIGGSLGLAVLVTIATTAVHHGAHGSGAAASVAAAAHRALVGGYDDAFRAGAVAAFGAFALAVAIIRAPRVRPVEAPLPG